MPTKVCIDCGKGKDITEFPPDKRRLYGCISVCRECTHAREKIRRDNRTPQQREKRRIKKNEYERNHPEKKREWDKTYRNKHQNKIAQQHHDYYFKNKEHITQYKKEWATKNREHLLAYKHQYYLDHIDDVKRKAKEYYDNNREEVNKRLVEYKKNNKQARIAHNYRSRIGAIVQGRSSGGRMRELVGCDLGTFIAHIESLWDEDMGWHNYGRGKGKWSLDHIIPLMWFNIEDIEERKKAFHFSNTQPMWYLENSSKSDRYSGKYKG